MPSSTMRAFLLFSFCVMAALAWGVEVMPLSAIKPGMKGEWRTVISGHTIQSFPLEVVGLSQSFVGPQRGAIIAKATDAQNILSGPVAGMSGSPVYIEGKLVGAYAYGFLWPKEQALIGIQPIAGMLELNTLPAATTWSAQASPPPASQESFSALPTPVGFAGLSASTLSAYTPKLAALGLSVSQAPMGTTAAPAQPLTAGSAVAAVLMSGDFSSGAVGTITWQEGSQVLAFGHGFLGLGKLDIPMANAEVLTVVQTYDKSFKLSNIGSIVGRFTHDSIVGIRGQMGPSAPMADYAMSFTRADGTTLKDFHGGLWPHPKLAPTLAAMAFTEALQSLKEFGQTQHYTARLGVTVRTHEGAEESFSWSPQLGTATAAADLADTLEARLTELLNNPFNEVTLTRLTLTAQMNEGLQWAQLAGATIASQHLVAGGTLPVVVTLQNYRGTLERKTIQLPIPARAGKSLKLWVGPASALYAQAAQLRSSATTWRQYAANFAQAYDASSLYLRLIEPSSAAISGGSLLESLPASLPANFSDAVGQSVLTQSQTPIGCALLGEPIELPITLYENLK